ncbi:MAG: hypothetical protein KGZ86_00010 [Candidatus Latescibacteria bacterium]|nr:hypothetical protein [Candidatus Latescibacterota bacterium]
MKHCKYVLILIPILVLISFVSAQEFGLNKAPCLYQGEIRPQTGTMRNTYAASVHYYDPDGKRPSMIYVFINDIGYTMKRASGKTNNGIYKTKLTLPPGKHAYYFYAEDDFGVAVRLPRYGYIQGPTVNVQKPYVKPASLSKGGLHQQTGTDAKLYTYTVNYYDHNDKPPKKIEVIVDGINCPMFLHKGSACNGIYLAQLKLPAGPHAYYFKALDAQGNCINLPEHGFMRGPEIAEQTNDNPKLLDVKLDPQIGYKSNRYTYNVTYIDKDCDPPSIIQIVINETPYSLRLKQGRKHNGVYSFKTSHYIGNYHNYYFYCEDGRGGSYRLPETGYFYGPVVVK